MTGLKLEVDAAVLTPIVEKIVAATLAKLDTTRDRMSDRIAFDEGEAARLLSLNRHQLRDERRRGRIRASIACGGRIRYCREDLLKYLADREYKPD